MSNSAEMTIDAVEAEEDIDTMVRASRGIPRSHFFFRELRSFCSERRLAVSQT
jgi:hypothetical protein